jgi:acylphosphatase
MKKCLSVRVTGRVQGVGFRFHTVKRAAELSVNGFVRNEPDGSVLLEAEGEEADVDDFVEWCRIGPRWARVDTIETWQVEIKDYRHFSVR